MDDTAIRVLHCKLCDSVWGRLERAYDYKDESDFVCDQCNQPERSKREDFSDLGHELTGIPTTKESWCEKCNEESYVIEKLKMRCSEHCGNTVREVQ